jgi:exonuclease V gamma subunit
MLISNFENFIFLFPIFAKLFKKYLSFFKDLSTIPVYFCVFSTIFFYYGILSQNEIHYLLTIIHDLQSNQSQIFVRKQLIVIKPELRCNKMMYWNQVSLMPIALKNKTCFEQVSPLL